MEFLNSKGNCEILKFLYFYWSWYKKMTKQKVNLTEDWFKNYNFSKNIRLFLKIREVSVCVCVKIKNTRAVNELRPKFQDFNSVFYGTELKPYFKNQVPINKVNQVNGQKFQIIFLYQRIQKQHKCDFSKANL